MPKGYPLSKPKKRAKRTLSKRLMVAGNLVEVISVSAYAAIIGRTRLTVIGYERDGKFPPAPISYKGVRYYTESLAYRIKPIVRKFPQCLKIPDRLQVAINIVYREEREKLLRPCQEQEQQEIQKQ